MDQDSTNGATGDKPKWRERLGIGAKDMPKISDEFKSQPFATPAAKPDARTPQPVIKLAPMAPRSHGQQPAAVTPVDREPRRGSENSEGLAEKLRAQRAAAEMLAVQRVSAARQRAEARIAAEPGLPAQRARTNDASSPDATQPRPKFSFAEDDQAGPRRGEPGLLLGKGGNGTQRSPAGVASATSLVPPRPALGGERPQPSLSRQPQSSYRPDSSPAYRPIDPATGFVASPSRTAAFGGQRAYSQEAGGLAQGSRNLARKSPYDPYRRNQDGSPYGAETHGEDWRGDPRLGRSLTGRGQGRAAEDEFDDDVFEDEPPPRRRAGASDYRSAYREAEDGDTDDRRRSNGPWLLLLALLVAAFAIFSVFWFWSRTSNVASNSAGDTVPLIAAPEQPAKTAAEKTTEGAGDAAAVSRKQIYDRIVGDREVTGDTVVPTEVTPIQPEAGESDTGGMAQPTGTNDQGTDEVVPLALPPATGQNTEGKIDQGTDQQAVAAAGQPEVEEVKSQTASQSGDTIASLLPATGTEEDAAAPETKVAATATASSTSETVKPEVQSTPPVQKKTAAAKKKLPAADSTASLGAEPVVIVPPGEIMAPSQETVGSGTLSAADAVQKQPPVRRKRTLLDLFNGNKDNAPSQDTVVVKQPAPEQKTTETTETKVASLAPETAKPLPEKQSGASGYVVQLASFRSQEEAQAEYARLRSKYPSVIGTLPSSIVQATVAGSTRHRLGLGPLATRDQASQICSSLIAGGERDCLVRKQ